MSLSISITSSVLMLQNGCLDHPSVGLLVHKVYCGKMVDWIRTSFGVVSGDGRKIGVLDVHSYR